MNKEYFNVDTSDLITSNIRARIFPDLQSKPQKHYVP